MPAFIVKYPQITVELVGQDGNAFNIMGIVCKALRQNKIAEKEVKQFQEECMSGDYCQVTTITFSRRA